MLALAFAIALAADDGRAALYVWDRAAGTLELAALEPKPGLDCVEAPDWGPDSRTLYFHAGPEGGPRYRPAREGAVVFRLRVADDGSAGPAEEIGAGAWPAASPDGRTLALSEGGSIVVAAADGSGRRTLGEAEVARWALTEDPAGGPPVAAGWLLVRTSHTQLGRMSLLTGETTPAAMFSDDSNYLMDFSALPGGRALVADWRGDCTQVVTMPLLPAGEDLTPDHPEVETLLDLPYESKMFVSRASLLPGGRRLGFEVTLTNTALPGGGRVALECDAPVGSADIASSPLEMPAGVRAWDVAVSPDGRFAALVSNAWYAESAADADGPLDLAVRRPASVGQQAGAVEEAFEVRPLGADVDQ